MIHSPFTQFYQIQVMLYIKVIELNTDHAQKNVYYWGYIIRSGQSCNLQY